MLQLVILCGFYLVRYLQRVVTHPSLLQDPDVREFLEREEVRGRRARLLTCTHSSLLSVSDAMCRLEIVFFYFVCVYLQLPRAVSTQALSGAGFLKMINKATDAVSKMTIKMNESDVVSSCVNRRGRRNEAYGNMTNTFSMWC